MDKYDLILLGRGPSMRGCPFDAEVWAALTVLGLEGWEDKPYSKAFCFDIPSQKPDEQAGLEVAQRRGIPIVSRNSFAFVTEQFPLREIREKFGHTCSMYMNDMSYMIALALYKGYKSLLLYGADQGPGEVYVRGRPFTTYWLGVATGMGVKWQLAPRCILWRQRL